MIDEFFSLERELEIQGAENWTSFQALLIDVPGLAHLPAEHRIFNLPGASEGRNMYTYFPWLFQQPEPSLTFSQLSDLSMASLLLLSHSTLTDRLIDENATSAAALLSAQGTLLWAWEMLRSAAQAQPLPWSELLKIYFTYAESLQMEAKALSDGAIEAENLIHLVAGKSALAKIITTAICSLGEEFATAPVLARSLDYFHLSSNLVDDLNDWKTDLTEGRFTYLLARILRRMGEWPEKGVPADPAFVARVASVLYAPGVLEDYFDEVEEWGEKAVHESHLTNCHRWTGYLTVSRMRLASRHNRVRAQARNLVTQASGLGPHLGARRNEGPISQSGPPNLAVFPESSISSATRAIGFLRSHFTEEHGLCDLWSRDGPRNILVTAAAGSAVRLWCDSSEDPTAGKLLVEMQSFVERERHSVWAAGSDPRLPEDGMTTALALGLILPAGPGTPGEESARRTVRRLLEFQGATGAFSRYRPDALAYLPSSWLVDDCDTSAAAILALLVSPWSGAQAAASRCALYLRSSLAAAGLWRSFWWSSIAFTNHLAVAALNAAGRPLSAQEEVSMREAVLSQQREDGSWPCLLTGNPSAFESAWSVRLLLLLSGGRQSLKAIARSVEWLLTNQLNDGSWSPRRVLRVPRADDFQPWRHSIWSRDPAEEMGVVLRDAGRCLTTAAVIGCMAAFHSRFGDRQIVLRPGRAGVPAGDLPASRSSERSSLSQLAGWKALVTDRHSIQEVR